LRKGNLHDFPRNQVYFGKTQINPNLQNNNNNNKNLNPNSLSQNYASSEKFTEFSNMNSHIVNFNGNANNLNLNVNHNKYPSYVSPLLEKTGSRYEISPPITNASLNKSKYILYDSTKNFIGNMNGRGINNYKNINNNNQNNNFNYNLVGNK